MAVNWLESWLKNKWVHHSLKFGFAVLITVLLAPFKLDVFEYVTYDFRMRLSPRPDTSGEVVLVPIEYDTLKKLKRDPEALDWAVVLQKIGQARPAQIVSFINPSQIQGSYDDLSFLAQTAGRLPFQYAEDDLPKTALAHLDALAPPFDLLSVQPPPICSREYCDYRRRFITLIDAGRALEMAIPSFGFGLHIALGEAGVSIKVRSIQFNLFDLNLPLFLFTITR